jgi:adenylate cyclase
VKNTGDGLLAEFPSVVDAVRCAAEVQRGMIDREREVPDERRIRFRIGINLGDVIAEEHDIFGDGVNVAARLEALAEPGGICISRVVRDQVRDRLDYTFEDLGEQQVKNIARPVRVYRVRNIAIGIDQPSGPSTLPRPLLDKPSIAVLSFTNMSGDPEQEFFADGIAEDVITALSRCPWFVVIARNSSFTFKGRAVDVKEIGRELCVRYVLEGSLRKAGDRIRVTAQLVEAETGKHVWAERYDRRLAELFAVQDDITDAVTIAIAPAVAEAELRRAIRRPPNSLDAWGAYQHGLWHLFNFSSDDNVRAQEFFEKAIDLDPAFASAYAALAWARSQAGAMLQTFSLADAQSSAEALARRAVALDPAGAEAHSTLSLALWLRGDYQGALAEADRALAISPNLSFAHATRGAALIFSGHPQEGLPAIETAMRLDPHDPYLVSRLTHMAVAFYFSGEYLAALEAAQNAIRSNPKYPHPYRWLAAALAQLGRSGEAREALQNAIAVAPTVFRMYVRKRVPWMRSQDHAHMLEGLRKAGLPEE